MKFGTTITILALAAIIPGINSGVIPKEEAGAPLVRRMNDATTLNLRGFDYIVSVHPSAYAGNSVSACTGALVSSRHVLTVQSCVTSNPDTFDTQDMSLMKVSIGKGTSNTNRNVVDYNVTRVFSGHDFTPSDGLNSLAVLELAGEVPANFAKPLKIYAGDYTATSPVKLAGYGTNGTQGATTSMTDLRYEYLHINDHRYCQSASTGYNNATDICALVFSGLSTCTGDYGALLMAVVDNKGTDMPAIDGNTTVTSEGDDSDDSKQKRDDSVIVNDDKANSNGYALLGLVSHAYQQGGPNPSGCVYGGNVGFFLWLYPYIEQIAKHTGLHESKFTMVNMTANNPNNTMHPGMDFPLESAVAEMNPDNPATRTQASAAVSAAIALILAAIFLA
ncbi:hypothetical protein GGF46_004288 [Coemansia sp. RSA 552]|nr:hypothetical protein GGF46_004288 [Coemansia sp. RSA 552]